MYDIRAATTADIAPVVALMVRLQADDAHHIGYHGNTAEEINELLLEFEPDWASGAVIAVDDGGRTRGVLSVETDPDIDRSWLHGPYVDVPANHPAAAGLWHSTADALLAAALRRRGTDDLELYGHRDNRLLAEFAERHGFANRGASRVFALSGPALAEVVAGPPDSVRPMPDDQAVRDAVIALHERCFPHRTVSGQHLVDARRDHTVVVQGAEGLVGYAAGFAQEAELYVDYVCVDEALRSVGAGRALVRGLVRELATRFGTREQAAAVVMVGNTASERMFTALGFDVLVELVAYRRGKAAPVPA